MQGNDGYLRKTEKQGKRWKTNLRLIGFILVAIVLAAMLLNNGRMYNERKVALDGEVLLNGDISFEEADQKLREAGFVPLDGGVSQEEAQVQRYEGREVYGHKAELSSLGYTAYGENSNMLAISHYFMEDPSTNMENPGESFTDIRQKLTQGLGKEPSEEEGFLFWQLKGKSSVMMGYVSDGFWMLVYSYTK